VSPIRRSDVVLLRAPKQPRGHEQRGQRYAVVIQSDDAEWLSTVIVAPTSTSAVVTAFRPEITVRGRRTCVLTDQLITVDRSRIGRTVGRLTVHEQHELDETIKDVLGLF
jgi:mRNA interferase MazF